MLALKRITAVFVLGVALCAGLFAENIFDNYFEGDTLNRQIRAYITNVSNLIPDSTTLQNVWSFAPRNRGGYFGFGFNGSITLLERKLASRIIEGAQGFGGSLNDLSRFPESIPFLPGMAFDFRGGSAYFDVGITGMLVDETTMEDNLGTTFLGENSQYSFRSLGLDFRYTFIRDGQSVIFKFRVPGIFVPALTVQGGYNFTWMGFGIASGQTEKVSVDFRNDSVFIALQATKKLPIFLTPYFGMKMIFSKTDSVYSWETRRPVMINETPYPEGAIYKSGGNIGEFYTYFQFYGGFGINFIFPHIITIGGAYNVVTEHFGINLSIRLLGGAGA